MNVVSLFSGAGGLDLGFLMAGHRIVWADDIYEDAVKTYRKNIGEHILLSDIETVNTENIPKCDIVIGGFPCQGFSVANIKRNESDKRNILYQQLLRIVASKKPIFFIAENVKGLMSIGGGKIFNMIKESFEELGYKVKSDVLNAADFGVPQTRQRVFIVGVKNTIDFDYKFPNPTHDIAGRNGLPHWISVSEALSVIPNLDTANSMKNNVYSKYKLEFSNYIGHRALDPNKLAQTVTARGDSKGGCVVLPHPNAKRRMSCRELATVQGFPLDYEFIGTLASVCRQIANAVPPPLAYAVANMLNSYKGE